MKHSLLLTILFLSAPLFATEYKTLHTAGGDILLPLKKVTFEEILGQNKKTKTRSMLANHKDDVGHSIRTLMSPVKNQGGRGTCNAFAAVALIEAFNSESYSEQCLARFSSSEDAGFVGQRLQWIRDNGLRRSNDCPYSSDRNRIPNLSHAPVIPFNFAFEAIRFWDTDAIEYLKSRLAVSSPVSLDVYVIGEAQWANGPFIYTPSDELIKDECSKNLCGNHSVVITGFNDTLGLIEFKNSWGSNWGNGGYGYMSYEYFLRFGNNSLISY